MEHSAFFSLGIPVFGGILVLLLGIVFFQLAGLQKNLPHSQTVFTPARQIERKHQSNKETPAQNKKEKSVMLRNMASRPDNFIKNNESGGSALSGQYLASNRPGLNGSQGTESTSTNLSVGRQSRDEQELAELRLAAAKMERLASVEPAANGKNVINTVGVFGNKAGSPPGFPEKEYQPANASTGSPISVEGSSPEDISVPVNLIPAPEKPSEGISKNLMDMFADEDRAESERNKVAQNLEEVGVHDLLEESQNLINCITNRKG